MNSKLTKSQILFYKESSPQEFVRKTLLAKSSSRNLALAHCAYVTVHRADVHRLATHSNVLIYISCRTNLFTISRFVAKLNRNKPVQLSDT